MKSCEVRAKGPVLVVMALDRVVVLVMQQRIVEFPDQAGFGDQPGDLRIQPVALFPESLSFYFRIDFHAGSSLDRKV
jgi:hypothetical protein